MAIKKTILKTTYITCKSIVYGYPFGKTCITAFKQCIKDITLDDLPSLACRIAAIYCGAPMVAIGVVGGYMGPEGVRKIKVISKVALNVCAAPVTAPAFFCDKALESVECYFFGEALPVLGDKAFLFD